MSHNITELDKGFVTGGKTWHGRPEYKVVGEVYMTDAIKCVSYPVRKLQAYTKEGAAIPGGYYAARMDQSPPMPIAPNLGERYEIIDRRQILNTFDENLLAVFPQLKIAGVGTLSAGRTFFIQFMAEQYHIRGDLSDHELRLCYSDTYGLTSHQVFCSHVRIVCDNTLRSARNDAIAANMMMKCRHTQNASMRINATAEEFAELHMGLQKDIEALEYLAGEDCNSETLDAFLDEFLPMPEPDPQKKRPGRALNVAKRGREDVTRLFEAENQSMSVGACRTRYALLQAYTDYQDHCSYSRSEYDRWMDAQYGNRAKRKQEAMQWLLQRT